MHHFYPLLRHLLFMLDAETAHNTTIAALRSPFFPAIPLSPHPRWATPLWGHALPHPIGLAAGFDKDAEAVAGLFKLGFSFVEVGTVTPQPQAGNSRPRVFRLPQQQAVINRYGFNSKGLDYVVANLRRYRHHHGRHGVLGANVGKNKNSEGVADFVTGANAVAPYVDYITLNISSPNTPGLRDLQHDNALTELLDRVQTHLSALTSGPKLVLKVAPDLDDEHIHHIAAQVIKFKLDGLIAGNTTLRRDAVPDVWQHEAGGLSGAPLFDHATTTLQKFSYHLKGKTTLIGCGGIGTPQQLQQKLAAGADVVQIYTGLIYQGPALLHTLLSS